jgi:hypothetical protein
MEGVIQILAKQWSACEHCAHQSVIRKLVEQFRMRRPRWWVVDGDVVVPIWIVERLKKHPEL